MTITAQYEKEKQTNLSPSNVEAEITVLDKYIITQYKFDKSIYDNLIPEFNTGFTNYEIVDEYLDTEDIVTTSTETMMLMNYDAEPDEYGVLTTEETIENISTFSAENIVTRTIYSNSLPTIMKFGYGSKTDRTNSLLEVNYLDTSNVTNMFQMFSNCNNLISLDVSNFDTSNVTVTAAMFQNCNSLTSLDVSNFDTSKVTNTNNMFRHCSSLTSLDINNWDISNVTQMFDMFNGCSGLTSLDLTNWETNSVTNISDMFYECKSLTSLDLSNWNISKVINISDMFHYCTNLTTLNISNWNASNVTNTNNMFHFCQSLTSVTMGNSDYNSVNKIIVQLPTRTTDSMGTLLIAGVDDISQVDTTTAQSKFWNVVNEELEKNISLKLGGNIIDALYIGDQRIIQIYLNGQQLL